MRNLQRRLGHQHPPLRPRLPPRPPPRLVHHRQVPRTRLRQLRARRRLGTRPRHIRRRLAGREWPPVAATGAPRAGPPAAEAGSPGQYELRHFAGQQQRRCFLILFGASGIKRRPGSATQLCPGRDGRQQDSGPEPVIKCRRRNRRAGFERPMGSVGNAVMGFLR